MAIAGSSKPKQTYVTGLGRFSVAGFNLTKKELEKLGVNLQEEPAVMGEREVTQDDTKLKVETCRITIWLRMESETVAENYDDNGVRKSRQIPNPHFGKLFRINHTIENRNWISAEKGKMQFLNAVGKSAWAANIADTPDYFKVRTPVYPALRGLAGLYEFLVAWTNIDQTKSDSIVMLGEKPTDVNEIFNGNFSIIEELNSLVPNMTSNQLNMLIGVDGSYQAVYGGKALGEMFTVKDKDNLYENATGQYGFKGDFQDSFVLQTYDPMAMLATPAALPKADTNAGNNTPSTTVDDLPF